MNPTLLLEHFMNDPRLADLLRQVRAAMPRSYVDAADRVVADADAAMASLAASVGGTRYLAANTDVPDWLRLGALDAVAGYVAGTAETCRHNPRPLRPQIVVAVAWRPGVVACVHCQHLLNQPDADADRRCDGCGHLCDGVEAGDPIYPGLVQLGSLIYGYGTCTGCRYPAV